MIIVPGAVPGEEDWSIFNPLKLPPFKFNSVCVFK